jgi:hypothetical protein
MGNEDIGSLERELSALRTKCRYAFMNSVAVISTDAGLLIYSIFKDTKVALVAACVGLSGGFYLLGIAYFARRRAISISNDLNIIKAHG